MLGLVCSTPVNVVILPVVCSIIELGSLDRSKPQRRMKNFRKGFRRGPSGSRCRGVAESMQHRDRIDVLAPVRLCVTYSHDHAASYELRATGGYGATPTLSGAIYARPNHERLSIPLFSLDVDNDDNIIKHDERKSSIYPSPRIPHGCK